MLRSRNRLNGLEDAQQQQQTLSTDTSTKSFLAEATKRVALSACKLLMHRPATLLLKSRTLLAACVSACLVLILVWVLRTPARMVQKEVCLKPNNVAV